MRDPTAARFDGVTAAYGDRVALADVSLAVPHGQLVGVVGPNGAGKSTLFKTLLGLVRPRAGRVEVLGGSPAAARRRVAYVPQRERVDWGFPVSAADVVLMGSYRRVGWLRWPGPAERARAAAALARVGLADRAHAQIGRLSGGQQQRVFVARALVHLGDAPGLLLLDEPLSGVDATSADAILALLRGLAGAGHAVLVSTHDLRWAAEVCDRVVLLNGAVVADGPPAQALTADALRAAYGGNVWTLAGGAAVVDDPTHHATAAVAR